MQPWGVAPALTLAHFHQPVLPRAQRLHRDALWHEQNAICRHLKADLLQKVLYLQNIRFVRDVGIVHYMEQGPIEMTGNPLDVALEGDGFFMVQGPGGSTMYTRDGAFTLTGDGRLVTSDGRAVLSSGGAPIVLDPQGDTPTIGRNGAITVAGVEAGRIGVASFAAPGALSKVGDNLWDASGQAPGEFNGVVLQGALEGSNVRPVVELTRLIEISRAYQSAAKIVSGADELRQRAIQQLGR